MAGWDSDAELLALMKEELFPAVVGDVMDRMGLTRQFLPPYLAPLDRGMVVVGRAMTVLEADISDDTAPPGGNTGADKPFGLMFEALDSLQPDEVYICTGSSQAYALWGGLMSTRAMHLKSAGAVLNGYVRDSQEILDLGFPVIARGCYAQDQASRGRVTAYRVPIQIGQARVDPGDIVFGDCDGVLIVPRAQETEVFDRALEKARGENEVRKALEKGMGTVEAFDKFGIM